MTKSARIGLTATLFVVSSVGVWMALVLIPVQAPSGTGRHDASRSETATERTGTTRTLRVSGVVLDPDDAAPVAGVVVRLDAGFAPWRSEAKTDVSGRFTVEFVTSATAASWPVSRRARLQVLEPDWISTVDELTLRQIEAGVEPRLFAAKLCGVRVRVHDVRGNTVPGAWATVTVDRSTATTDVADSMTSNAHACGFEGRETRAAVRAIGVTVGVVELRGTRWMESRRLQVSLPDGRRYSQSLSGTSRCGELTDVEVVVPEIGATIEGVLRHGQWRTEGAVRWEWEGWGSSLCRTRGDGEFELRDVPPGRVTLKGSVTQRESVEVTIDVPHSGVIAQDLTIPVE